MQQAPEPAAHYCYAIYQRDPDPDRRHIAIQLLRDVATRPHLGWVSEFLADPDPMIQTWGSGVLDQLLWSERVSAEEAEETLQQAEHHLNEAVRDTATFIRGYLSARASDDEATPAT